VIFQQYVPKRVELRVTVVGRRVFAAEIDSQASRSTRHDWRHYDDPNVQYRIHTLPPEMARACVRLVEALGLSFGAIDLIQTPEGKYVFLEINPNGQWGWIEDLTGLPISDAIADWLAGSGEPDEGET
jgi:glutathione synthase/RimK-type ligase-like ATP-grasp enzyme